MSYDPIDDALEAAWEKEYKARAAICRKYAEQYYVEKLCDGLPNLALIINDAIGEAIELHMTLRKAK